MHQRQPLVDRRAIRERVARRNEPHVAPLNDVVRRLRRDRPGVPYFDPDGAGVNARLLLLLEAPGLEGAALTGIVSVDNQDRTAKNTSRLLARARLDPRKVLNWNIVPWSSEPTSAEIRAGAACLPDLLKRLKRLRVVVCMGVPAQRGWAEVQADFPNLKTVRTWHPVQRRGHEGEVEIVRGLRVAGRLAGLK